MNVPLSLILDISCDNLIEKTPPSIQKTSFQMNFERALYINTFEQLKVSVSNLNNRNALKQQFRDWLRKAHHFNFLATITFEQCRLYSNGNFERYTREKFEATCLEVGRRIKKHLKRKYLLAVNDIYWVTSIENGRGDKRYHAHMLFDVSIHIDRLDFESAFRNVCSRMDKIHRMIDLRELENRDGDCQVASMTYILKEDVEALALPASFIRRLKID